MTKNCLRRHSEPRPAEIQHSNIDIRYCRKVPGAGTEIFTMRSRVSDPDMHHNLMYGDTKLLMESGLKDNISERRRRV